MVHGTFAALMHIVADLGKLPRWYGVGGTIQLAIFGMIAAKVKMNANGAHTFLEVMHLVVITTRSYAHIVTFADSEDSLWHRRSYPLHILRIHLPTYRLWFSTLCAP